MELWIRETVLFNAFVWCTQYSTFVLEAGVKASKQLNDQDDFYNAFVLHLPSANYHKCSSFKVYYCYISDM